MPPYMGRVVTGVTEDQVNKLTDLNAQLGNWSDMEKQMEHDLQDLRISNAEALLKIKLDAISKEQKAELAAQFEVDKRFAALEAKQRVAKEKQNKGIASKEDTAFLKRYEELMKNKAKIEEKWRKKAEKDQEAREKKRQREEARTLQKEHSNNAFGTGRSFSERIGGIKGMFTDNATGDLSIRKGLAEMTTALSDMAKQLDGKIEQIAGYKTSIDTRLQGSSNRRKSGSYWDAITKDITSTAGASPFIKQSDLANNVQRMVAQGIAFNVDQRAFLATISDKIATTFDAANGTLLRIVRIQQADSTAARLGAESALTSYLNNMFNNTEYLSGADKGVSSALEEAEALMSTEDATAFNYQARKWLGSLYSTGMSSNAVSGLASALGQLGAGNISGLTGSGMGNLLIMAASNSGLSLGSLLKNGLNADSTNLLMAAVVSYLQNIAGQTSGNKLLGQQYANVFGLTAADLKAAANIGNSLSSISGNSLSYGGALGQLAKMTGSIGSRVSTGQKLSNIWDNLQYSMAAGIASNPALYATYKAAGLLDAVAGGVALPDIMAFGSGVQMNTTVADIMRTAAFSGGILSSMGQLISGGGGLGTASLLKAMGFNGSNYNTAINSRGDGGGSFMSSGYTTSESGFIGNSSSGDIYNASMLSKESTGESVKAQQPESKYTPEKVNESVVKIYELLCNITQGTAQLHVVNSLNTSSFN